MCTYICSVFSESDCHCRGPADPWASAACSHHTAPEAGHTGLAPQGQPPPPGAQALHHSTFFTLTSAFFVMLVNVLSIYATFSLASLIPNGCGQQREALHENSRLLSCECPCTPPTPPAGWSVLHSQGFLTLSCEKGCSVHGPRCEPLLIPGHMTSISRFTSWYKMAAPATAIMSAFPPARRKKRKD